MNCNSLVDAVRPDVLTWLESVRHKGEGWGRWQYNAAMFRSYGLQCSGMAVQILYLLDELDAVPQTAKNEAVAWLQSTQDPRDGYFKDPLVTPDDHEGKHSWEEIFNQWSSTQGALLLLGGAPLHPMPAKRFVDLGEVDPREWVLSHDWVQAWNHSEIVSRCINARADALGLISWSEDPIVTRAFETYENELLDLQTGLPTRKGASLPVAMCGLFKIMFSHLRLRRDVPHAERAVDTILGLQNPEGEIGARRNMCMNYDALWVLYYLNRQLGGAYRFEDIRAAGNRVAACLMDVYRKPDGGFSFNGEMCQHNHHSVRISPKLPIGDMLGTHFAVRSLAYADEWNGVRPLRETPSEGAPVAVATR